MGWRVISVIFVLLGIGFLPFWPYPHPWPSYASLAICGFCFFFSGLTFVISVMGRRGSAVWKGRGHG